LKVAVLGGTGIMGREVARRLAEDHLTIIGSRDRARAEEAAKTIPGATGADYLAASRSCEAAIVAIPHPALGALQGLAGALEGKLVVSMVNPLKLEDGVFRYALDRGSAAESIAELLPGSRIATAFNNIPPGILRRGGPVEFDVLVAAGSKEAYEEVAKLVSGIKNLRPLYAGPLSEAAAVERITPLVLNLARWNRTGALGTRFITGKG
jgi:8-hydroxy-5-deazaflavin:NADPH oxidoreductase